MNDGQPATDLVRDAVDLQQHGRLAEAEAKLRQFLTQRPQDFDALQNLGIIIAQQGRFADAAGTLKQALALRPDSADALYNLGLVLQNLGDHIAAIGCYTKMLAQGIAAPEVQLNLGNAYLALERLDDAAASYQQAIRLDGSCAPAINNLGLCREKADLFDDAAQAYEQATQIAPDYIDPLINLAQLRLRANRSIDAAALLRRALELRPDMVQLRQMLAQIYVVSGDIDLAIAERQQAVAWAPEREELQRELILDLNFADGDDGARVLEACRQWHRRFAQPVAVSDARHFTSLDPEKNLRIGWIGGWQFCGHTLAAMLLPLAEAYDRTKFEWFCYSDLSPDEEDGVSARFKNLMTWRRTSTASHDDLARQITADEIDIVIDPVGFVGGSRLLTLARRPAPIQISFPLMGTSGGTAIDYVLADHRLLPVAAEQYFTERVLRIPFAYCYSPLAEPPSVSDLPVHSAGHITFGSLNSLPKLSLRAIGLWRRILDGVAHSRLLIKGGLGFRDSQVRDVFLARLVRQGIDISRVELVPWTPNSRDHLAVYNRIDVALDSLPYCGITTTYEALLMGVPVVTRTGARVLDRYAASILAIIGLEAGIATSDDDYVARAIALAGDLDGLHKLRLSLRDRLLASLACDGRAVAATLDATLRQVWQEWCARA